MCKIIVAISFFAFVSAAHGATKEERLAALESIALYEPSDMVDEEEVIPNPDDVKKKFGITDAQLYQDILDLTKKYSIAETNAKKRSCRETAVYWLGFYGSTNDLSYLNIFFTNSVDSAQESAMFAVLNITLPTELYIPAARSIVTNRTVFSPGLRDLAYCSLHKKCMRGRSSSYVDDPALHARIAAFFLERAGLEDGCTLYVDQVACELNPTYKHSQERRNNLAKLRKPNLTGLPAKLYDEAQRDAEGK